MISDQDMLLVTGSLYTVGEARPILRSFLWVSLIYWTYRDAKKRAVSGIYWAPVALFFNIFGWLIYLVVRPPEYLDDVRERALEIKAKEALLASSGPPYPL